MEEKKIFMETIERKIYSYLEKYKDEEFNVLQISRAIKHGYPAVLKYVMVLEAKGFINVNDYGNQKRIKWKKTS